MNDKHLVFSFGSTFVQVECLVNLAPIALKNHPDKDKLIKEVDNLTIQGKEGIITHTESLVRRLNIIKPNQTHIDQLIRFLKSKVSPSFIKHKKFFQENKNNVYVVSNAFKQIITPVVADFGIAPDHVLANSLTFDKNGNVKELDRSIPSSNIYGKALAVAGLRLTGKTYVIGDCYTDLEIKNSGFADYFIAYIEDVTRKSIIKHADYIARNLDDVLEFINST